MEPHPPRAARLRNEVALFVAVFAAVTTLGLIATEWSGVEALGLREWRSIAAMCVIVVLAVPQRIRRASWHLLANLLAFEAPRRLASPWVIDGDTIDDRASGVRYRLANIDAPETGDNAKCYNERRRGELARAVAIQLVRDSRLVSVRRTWRTDRYGRRVAFVMADGADIGETLMARGLARPWRGRRETWCGPRGGLAKIAQMGAVDFACQHCSHWR